MVTWDTTARFDKDLADLDPDDRRRFQRAVADFADDLRSGRGFRPGLRVKRVVGTRDIWEMTWAPDGRGTWQYGDEIRRGEAHVIWRRVGTHDVLRAA